MMPQLSAPLVLALGALFVVRTAFGQLPPGQPPSGDQAQAEAGSGLVYKPPSRGAPEGRVGGGSRSALVSSAAMPHIELVAPGNHTGFTAHRQPNLYFFISRPVPWPMQFTISAPLRPAPVLEVRIPSPRSGGIYELSLRSFGVRLEPGTAYTWSVSVLLDLRGWSRNIVTSALIVCDPTLGALIPNGMGPPQRAAYFAEKGLWYDAVSAAVEAQRRGAAAAMASLLRQGGLIGITANAIEK